ncbi:MAG TPA: hypothetical protein VGO59_04515 [Verrucomicrobiae bacterium]|jgi:hypothetical protein
MNSEAQGADAPSACQPFTFGGVAAFAGARLGRLLAVELAVAVIAAGAVVWFLYRAYCPVILQAIQNMPETARVANGALQGVPDTFVAESRFLAIAARPASGGEIGQDADLQLQLRPNDVCTGSVFWPDWGWVFPYGRHASVNLARSNLEPWWSAWQPVLLAGAGAATVLWMFLVWGVLAAIYMAPAKFVAWFADRALPWGAAWRMASAALMPGAVFMAAAILLYGWSVLDLVGLSFCFAVHVIISWIYVAGGACKVARLYPNQSNRNPFTALDLPGDKPAAPPTQE